MAGPDIAAGDAASERSRIERSLPFLLLGLMAMIVLVTYADIVWTLRRGFDLTDEAFVYTMIASNRIATEVPLGFQHLLHPLYELTGESVLAFRLIRLVAYVLLSVALVSGARSVVSRLAISITRSGWVFVLLLAQVGTFIAWSYPPRYVSYNEAASWGAQVGVALIVLSLSWGVSSPRDQRVPWALWSIWAGLGAVTSLLVFAKVTSALAFGAILVLVLCVPNPNLRLWKRVVATGAGAVSVLFVLLLLGVPIASYVRNSAALLLSGSAQDASGHPLSKMIATYMSSLQSTGEALIPALLIYALAMATLLLKRRRRGHSGKRKAVDQLTWILGILLLITLAALPRTPVWPYLAALVCFIGAAGIIGLTLLAADAGTMRGSKRSQSFSVFAAVAAVVAAPFISAVGTNNGLTEQFVFAATLWAVVLGIALVLLTHQATLLRSSARSLPALIGCLVVGMAAMAVKSNIAEPYRNPDLLSQKTSTSVPELRGLLLNTADAAWIDWVSAEGDSLGAEGVPATAMASTGALYAFNHSGYASPWIGRDVPGAFKSLSTACTTDPPTDLFLLQPGTSTPGAPSTAGITHSLAACRITFPSDFRVVARYASADPEHAMIVWRLRNERLGPLGHG